MLVVINGRLVAYIYQSLTGLSGSVSLQASTVLQVAYRLLYVYGLILHPSHHMIDQVVQRVQK